MAGARWPAQLLSLVLLALAADADSGYDGSRRLLRDLHQDTCANTAQGINYMADSKGMLCTRDDLDAKTGCCKTGQLHACERCSMVDRCCSELEFCVSCCLAPQHDAEALAKITLKAPKNKDAGMWGNSFEYCRGVCRTHSTSTAHENAYISSRHHCFSKLGKPLLSDPLPQGALGGVHLLMSEPGEDCSAACQRSSGRQCSQQHLLLLNTCDRLREHRACEAGCEAMAPGQGPAVPSYVDPGAPKAIRPAMCFTSAAATAPTCGGREGHHRRLCPCM